VFLGALIGLLCYLRVIRWFVYLVGGAIAWVLRTSKLESVRAAIAEFGPQVDQLSPKTVLVTTFALAGFANFASIAIQIGAIGALAPDRRADVARFGLKALLAGSLVNFSNAAIAGVVASV